MYADLGFDVGSVDIAGLESAGPADSVLVLPHVLVPMQELITRLHLADAAKPGIFDRNFEDPDRYRPVDPDVPVDRTRPKDAVSGIGAGDRLPLTIE